MINIIGQFFGTSGYSNHTRYLANALSKLTEVSLQTNLPQGFERLVNDKELEMIKRETDNEINLIVTHPVFWRVNCGAKRNFVYLVWEGDTIPKWMIDECMNPEIDKIIVPSEHTRKAMEKGFHEHYDSEDGMSWDLRNNVVVIPHGVDLETFYPTGINPVEGRTVVPFTFLMNKGFRNLEDRGGVQYGIKAYLEEFTESEQVELIVKLNPAYGIPNIKEMFPCIKEKGVPKITFITDDYTPKQLNDLYNQADVFLSPTRAEAFNLPCLEAMACGKMCLVTGYGGQCDFVCDGVNGLHVDYKLVNVEHELEYEGIKWATVDINDLKKKLRWCYENKDKVAKFGGQGLKTSKSLTWNEAAKKIHSLTRIYR